MTQLQLTIDQFLKHHSANAPVSRSVLSRVAQTFGDRLLIDLTFPELFGYVKELSVAPKTLRNYTSTLQQFVFWVFRQKHIKANSDLLPARFLFDYVNPEVALTDEEVNRLLDAVKEHPRNFTMISVIAHCGLTAESTARLQVGDYDDSCILAWEKGIKREMRLGQVGEILNHWLETHPGKPTDPMFYSESTGKALTPRAIRYVVSRAAQKAVLERQISFDGFYARRALRKQHNIAVFQARAKK